MQTKISESGPTFSRIVAGVMKWGIWGADYDSKQVEALIKDCLELGVTTFDHADIYGHYTTEALFGPTLKNNPSLRSGMQLVTKCGINLITPNRPQIKIKSYNTSKSHIIASVEQSLINLGTDYIDLLLIHRPSPLMHPEEVASAFTQLKDAGKVLHFGVSNFSPAQFDLLHHYFPLCTNQVEASLMHLDPLEDGTFDQALKYKCQPMIWSPLGAGAFFSETMTEQAKQILKVANQLAKNYDAGLDQILLAWLLRHPAGLLPVLGTSKSHRLKDGVDALSIQLDQEDWFRLLEAAKGEEVA